LGDHCINDIAWKWSNLEQPNYFDREAVVKLCHSLAYEQWMIPEIESGYAWGMLND